MNLHSAYICDTLVIRNTVTIRSLLYSIQRLLDTLIYHMISSRTEPIQWALARITLCILCTIGRRLYLMSSAWHELHVLLFCLGCLWPIGWCNLTADVVRVRQCCNITTLCCV